MIIGGTVGVVLTFTVKRDGSALNISTATTKNLILRSPAGPVKTFAASFVTDGSDGKIRYTTTAATDLDAAGDWLVTASIVMTGWTGQTTGDTFSVAASN